MGNEFLPMLVYKTRPCQHSRRYMAVILDDYRLDSLLRVWFTLARTRLLRVPRLADSPHQRGRGLVVRVLPHQFPPKRFRQQGRREPLDPLTGGQVARFETLGIGKQFFDAPHDFGLFVKRWQIKFKTA